jgi:SNF2 family DNA or RNA helicase
LAKEQSIYHGGICADACGMGKTHEIISLIIAGRQYWTLQGRKCGPTLVVCPNSLKEKWFDDLFDMLGLEFEVRLYKKTELIENSQLFQQQDTSKVVVLATYEQLGVAKTIGEDQ